MALNNTLQKAPEQERGVTEYECGGQMVKLSPTLIKKYLVNGDGLVTDQEVMMFLSLCKFQKLNPFLREAYLIKYGNQPATIVTGKEAFMKRAMRNPRYAGHEAGVVVLLENGLLDNRVGTVVLDGEKLVGGWARVHIEGWKVPMMLTASFEEYVGRKKNGEVNQQWATKPASMIRKVALVQALREAFPEDLGGMYTPEEKVEGDLPEEIISEEVITAEPVEEPKPEPETKKEEQTAAQALFGK